MKVKCSEIKIGDRVRKNLGSIEELSDSIEKVGLLQPIGVTKDYELVFGERRLAACKSLNYEEIEIVMVDSEELLECETTENVNRKNFVMSERVAIREIYKEKFIEEKGKLMAKGIKIKKTGPESGPKFLQHKLAKLSGVSRDTANKENVIMKHGDQELIDKVDKNELSVNKAYNLVQKIEEKSKVYLNNEKSKNEVYLENNENFTDKKGTSGIPEFFNTEKCTKLTKTLADKIEQQADELGMSVSSLIRSILEQYFK